MEFSSLKIWDEREQRRNVYCIVGMPGDRIQIVSISILEVTCVLCCMCCVPGLISCCCDLVTGCPHSGLVSGLCPSPSLCTQCHGTAALAPLPPDSGQPSDARPGPSEKASSWATHTSKAPGLSLILSLLTSGYLLYSKI